MDQPLTDVATLLDEINWQYIKHENAIVTFVTGTNDSSFFVTITLSDPFVCSTIWLDYDALFLDKETLVDFLELNLMLPWIKLGINPEKKKLGLSIDCPKETLDSDILDLAFSTLLDIAEMLSEEYVGLITGQTTEEKNDSF